MVRSLDGAIEFCNNGGLDTYGFSKDEVLGRPFYEVSETELPVSLQEINQQVLSEGQWNGDLVHFASDGRKVIAATRLALVKSESGEAKSILEISNDVTDGRLAAQRVSEFYASVSHELRTPFASIRAGLGILDMSRADLPDHVLDIVQVSKAECERLTNIVNDLLDLSKIEAGMLPLDLALCSPVDIAERAISSVKYLAYQRDIEILRQGNASSREILCDGERIQQVLVNLLSNSISYSPTGSTIFLTVALVDRSVRFAVQDNGPGIPGQYGADLFKPFFQISPEGVRRTEGVGTGLGLAISKAIIDQHGGLIGFDSVINKGSRFWFELPCQQM